MRMPPPAALLFAALLVPYSSQAQDEPVAVRPTRPTLPDSTFGSDSALAPDPPNCLRAQPRPPCPGFLVTEFGIEVPLRSTRQPDAGSPGGRHVDYRTRVVWTFGLMSTRGRHSHGPAVSFSSDEGRTGINRMYEWRYRRWLNQSAAMDAGLGYRSAEVFEPGMGVVRARGGTLMLAFTPNRYIDFSARADLSRTRGRNHGAVLLGAQSTRLSEVLVIEAARLAGRMLLAAIGIRIGDEE